jgi:hypothetical protein
VAASWSTYDRGSAGYALFREDAPMARPPGIILVALLLILAGAHVVLATISPSGIDTRLRLDWEIGQSRGGRPEIQGYVINDYMRAAVNVRLLVESLDDNGQAIGQAYGFVVGGVPALSRAPFVVPLETAGSSYRIRVTDFIWKDGGSAGGAGHDRIAFETPDTRG